LGALNDELKGHYGGRKMTEKAIGEITHYYKKISVAVLSLQDEILLGDRVHILGHTTDFQQGVGSMQIDHTRIERAEPGDDVAIKVYGRVRPGDIVYRVLELN
jgi:hypothetical protein